MSILHDLPPLPKIDLSILRLMVKVFHITLAYLPVLKGKLLLVGQAFQPAITIILGKAGWKACPTTPLNSHKGQGFSPYC
jgi:hypothetical protein